jgi:uncharacterized protein YjgD (DUF1641 family)
MARPIALELPPRNPAAELRTRLDNASAEHGEALLTGYEVLQVLHEQGVFEILRGVLSAKDEILDLAVTAVNTPEAIRAIRNLLNCGLLLASIQPEWLKALAQAIPEGMARATAERDKPAGLWELLRRIRSKDSLRAMAAAVNSLQAFGRHLHSFADASSDSGKTNTTNHERN